jgi:hypothetical protein
MAWRSAEKALDVPEDRVFGIWSRAELDEMVRKQKAGERSLNAAAGQRRRQAKRLASLSADRP